MTLRLPHEESAESGSAGQDSQAQPSVYDYSRPVPQSPAVDSSYFDDAVFIGDSRTEGMITATGLYNAKAFTHKGLTVDTAFKDLVVCIDEQYYTVVDALSHTDFNKVYIMLGLNEAGYPLGNLFDAYQEDLDQLRQLQPNATIYILKVYGVTADIAAGNPSFAHSRLTAVNKGFADLADGGSIRCLDSDELFCGSDGFMLPEYTGDGVHPYGKYAYFFSQWLCEQITQGK